jgi:hypothetical protein
MKVYGCPKEAPAPEIDYANYNAELVAKQESDHVSKLKEHLVSNGYKGKHTGEIVRFHVADGYAAYMLADGPKSCLIHLPYGDAYQYPDAQFLPKAEIMRRIESDKKMASIFAKKEEEPTGSPSP